jgi:hypothetical protein
MVAAAFFSATIRTKAGDEKNLGKKSAFPVYQWFISWFFALWRAKGWLPM